MMISFTWQEAGQPTDRGTGGFVSFGTHLTGATCSSQVSKVILGPTNATKETSGHRGGPGRDLGRVVRGGAGMRTTMWGRENTFTAETVDSRLLFRRQEVDDGFRHARLPTLDRPLTRPTLVQSIIYNYYNIL